MPGADTLVNAAVQPSILAFSCLSIDDICLATLPVMKKIPHWKSHLREYDFQNQKILNQMDSSD
jgi:hypothetical protein